MREIVLFLIQTQIAVLCFGGAFWFADQGSTLGVVVSLFGGVVWTVIAACNFAWFMFGKPRDRGEL